VTAPAARIDRVLGEGPFREIGLPRVTATSPGETLIAVGGAHVRPQWHGRTVRSRSRPGPGWHPVAVYRIGDLACLLQTTTRWPVESLAFHPTYGAFSAGLRAVEQLRLVFAELHAVTIRDSVGFQRVWEQFDADGRAADPAAEAAAKVMLDRLAWWGHTLREAKVFQPYPV
jgi:hypothetical protein